MTKVRTGPDCASIGLAQDAFAGVKHSPAFSRLAQRRIAGVLFAARSPAVPMAGQARSHGGSWHRPGLCGGVGLAGRGAAGDGPSVAVAEQQVGWRPGQQGEPVGGDPVGQDGQDGVAARTPARISRPLRLASTMPSPPGVSGNSATIPAAA